MGFPGFRSITTDEAIEATMKADALRLRRERFQHDKDNDAFGLVHDVFDGRPMLWFSGADFDTSAYMARLPDEA
jgi:hypothetical protein